MNGPSGPLRCVGQPRLARGCQKTFTESLILSQAERWRRALLRNLRRRTPVVETNVAAHVGRPAIVLTEVTERSGLVKLAGEEWSARSAEPGWTFPVGADVSVVRIDGATALVGPPGAPAQPPSTPDDAPDDAPDGGPDAATGAGSDGG